MTMLAPEDVRKGARGVLTEDFNLAHIGVFIAAGSAGQFTEVDEDCAWFRLDDPIENLHDSEWENELAFAAEDAHCWTEGRTCDPRVAAAMNVRREEP